MFLHRKRARREGNSEAPHLRALQFIHRHRIRAGLQADRGRHLTHLVELLHRRPALREHQAFKHSWLKDSMDSAVALRTASCVELTTLKATNQSAAALLYRRNTGSAAMLRLLVSAPSLKAISTSRAYLKRTPRRSCQKDK